MAFAVGYSLDEAKLLLVLAAAAYLDEKPLPKESVEAQAARMRKDINSALGAAQYGAWQVAWGPGLTSDRSNMMYVAGNATTNQYAVAIRGTDWSFWLDWLEDLASLLPLAPFPFVVPPAGSDVKVAAGTLLGLDELTAMTGLGSTGSGTPVTLQAFVQALPPTAEIYVTGHSLGGCLASVTAAWLASVLGGAARLKTYTFAAPSAGNGAFASYYNTLFTDAATGASTAYRVYNTLDSVPNAWATLPTIETYYQPAPPCPTYVKDIVDDAQKDVGGEYVQVGTAAAGSAVALPGTVVPWHDWWNLDPTGTAQFVHQVTVQHETTTYQGLLTAIPAPAPTLKMLAIGARRSRSE